jgi:ABC-type cobalamin/Fe3+-siderophores transport system ATPase subunit
MGCGAARSTPPPKRHPHARTGTVHRVPEEQSENPLRKYTVRGLFGRGPFAIEFEPGGVSILTGANGTGKSTVLRTIDRFARGAWNGLSRLPFESLSLKFARGPVVRVDRTDDGLKFTRGKAQWRYRRARPRSYTWYGGSQLQTTQVVVPTATFDELEGLGSVGVASLGRTLGEHVEPTYWIPVGENQPQPDWLTRAVDDLTILFITDQRLVVEDRSSERGEPSASRESVRVAVSEYASDLQRRIERAVGTYGDRAQELDRAFPSAVLRAMRKKKPPSEERTFEALRALDKKREELERLGLVRAEESPPELQSALDSREIAVISAYADTALEKYAVLDHVLSQVRAFTDFLNRRYSGKQIRIDRDQGFVVALRDGSIEPSDLSSGEQQMLVLAYQIIFLAAPGTLVLIDEPELSLHVNWQTTLVDDLVAMGSPNRLSFIVATHSPTLIGGRRSLRRSLDRSPA